MAGQVRACLESALHLAAVSTNWRTRRTELVHFPIYRPTPPGRDFWSGLTDEEQQATS